MSEIVSVATLLPGHRLSAEDTTRHLAEYLPAVTAERYARIVDATRIRQRFTVVPVAELLRLRTVQERNDAYVSHARALGAEVSERALEGPGEVAPRNTITSIISVSCTGYMMPSLDAYLTAHLGLPPATRRIPLTELGCSAGVGAIGVAAELLSGCGEASTLVVSVELSSLSVQLAEPSTTDMFANLLFSDGAAAAVVSSARRGRGPEIVATRSVLWDESANDLGMRLTDGGFRLVLSPRLPRLIERRLRAVVDEFLHAHAVALEDVEFWIVHPGGPKILDAVASGLQLPDRLLAPTWETWEEAGNLSSATVFFVLEHLRRSAPPRAGSLGLMLAFGPGVTCEMVLLRSGGWLSRRD